MHVLRRHGADNVWDRPGPMLTMPINANTTPQVLSCIITLSGPSRWEWWVALIPAVGIGIAAAYLVQFLVNRCCRKLEIHPTNV